MTHVITQQCCNDAACVPVCPVNCIHPTPDEPDYLTAEMLYIDPEGCIDCGACVVECPVNAIEPDYDLPPESMPFVELNAAYFDEPGRRDYDHVPHPGPVRRQWSAEGSTGPLRVAVVGTGPAASYTVQHLLAQRGLDVRIDVFEKLLTPTGLVRFGVAPDHQSTKQVADTYQRAWRNDRVRMFLGVEIGRDLDPDELARRYHAVVYGVGAPAGRRLGIEGEDLPGSHAATDVVAWYNGHPEHATAVPAIDAERAVVIGNGNVALDIARLLALDAGARGRTDMADHAVDVLSATALREIRVMGRRGADMAAFTVAELIGLRAALGARLVRSEELGPLTAQATAIDSYKRSLVEALPTEAPADAGLVVVLDFCRTPIAVTGTDRVAGLRWARTEIDPTSGVARASTAPGDVAELTCGLVISAIGSRSVRLGSLPFDEARGLVPNTAGRVLDPETGAVRGGLYVTGWAKRGPQGTIGTNRHCATETTDALLDDFLAGELPAPSQPGDIAELLPDTITVAGWTALDAHEKKAGRESGRPRVKVVDTEAQRAVITAALWPERLAGATSGSGVDHS
ncbi:4Fe-4S binding protein [Nocardioides sp. BP30]|uniref:4Fe-4S binding protein n=1 Tax=Nocardioides sp. BP30 TaxID=3036374 RepID=UPI002468C6D8|nr:4Fe-4S binding protein [Nocardioides sp. BP30]WGL54145.1 4Fe-4S binding protein [Nocardioides sp. BP30]